MIDRVRALTVARLQTAQGAVCNPGQPPVFQKCYQNIQPWLVCRRPKEPAGGAITGGGPLILPKLATAGLATWPISLAEPRLILPQQINNFRTPCTAHDFNCGVQSSVSPTRHETNQQLSDSLVSRSERRYYGRGSYALGFLGEFDGVKLSYESLKFLGPYINVAAGKLRPRIPL